MAVTGTKVLYLITKSNWGGAQHYVYDMATAAKAAGFDVVVGHGGEGALAKKLHEAGVLSVPIACLERDMGVADFAAYKNIKSLIRAEQPVVVHLNSSKAGLLGALAARRLGTPKIIFTAHGWPFMERRNILWRTATWFASWVTALCAHTVIAVSDSELRLTRAMPFCAHKAVRIYNGIDLGMKFGSGDVIRRAFPKGVHVTGTVGELTQNKNQIALIEQAKRNPSMYLAIVGEGEDRTILEAKIKEYRLEDRVRLFGFIPAADVLKGFDTFALPSKKEALAFVILEARVAGLPIVANRVGGVGEAMDRPLSDFALERMAAETLATYRTHH